MYNELAEQILTLSSKSKKILKLKRNDIMVCPFISDKDFLAKQKQNLILLLINNKLTSKKIKKTIKNLNNITVKYF